MSIAEVVYPGHDNVNVLRLYVNNVVYDLNDITKMEISFPGKTITSENSSSAAIRWNKMGYTTGEVRLFLGAVTPAIKPGSYTAYLTVWDALNPNGLVWGKFKLTAFLS
jgi:hypothetical protein